MLASALLAAGCYRYVPVELETVPAGEGVRMYLTRTGMAAITELPMEAGPIVTGTLVSQDNGDVLLRVPIATRQQGFHIRSIGQDVRIPTGDIIQVERRQLDRLGTGLLIGGTGAVAALVMTLILDSRSDVVNDDSPVPELRVPLFMWRMR